VLRFISLGPGSMTRIPSCPRCLHATCTMHHVAACNILARLQHATTSACNRQTTCKTPQCNRWHATDTMSHAAYMQQNIYLDEPSTQHAAQRLQAVRRPMRVARCKPPVVCCAVSLL
jgi:hypothetical protein